MMKPSGKTPFMPNSDITFNRVIDGVEVASVVADHATGGHGTFVRFAPGVKLPMNHCDEALGGLLVRGKVSHPVPGNRRCFSSFRTMSGCIKSIRSPATVN
jgi:hypothetical protein